MPTINSRRAKFVKTAIVTTGPEIEKARKQNSKKWKMEKKKKKKKRKK
jgi:hypothetical protein